MLDKLQLQKEHLEKKGFNVAYIAVYGSQNYGLDVHTPEYNSDLDMKAVVIPSLDDLVYDSAPISTTYETQWGICDIKDIRVYLETLCKCNPSYIETLYTDYYIGTPLFDEIRALRREIVWNMSYLFFRAAFGMMMEKEKALCHPYPSIADKIEKYGYDPKQLHHIARLKLMIDKFVPGETEPCFMNSEDEKAELIKLKVEPMRLEYALMQCEVLMASAKAVVDIKMDTFIEDYTIKTTLKNIVNRIIKDDIINKIVNHEEGTSRPNNLQMEEILIG